LTADETATGAVPVGADPPKAGASRGRAVGILAGTAAVVLGLDALTKQLAVSQLADREPVRLLGGAVYLVLTRNSGAAFSLGTRYTIVFPLVTVIVVGWIAWMARRLRSLPWALSLGLVLGGALGNFTDRLFRAPGPLLGHVVDFISVFDAGGQVFPVFNLADSALTVGVILAVLLELTGRRREGGRTRSGS
jgi:signal peptidase II